MGLTVVVGPPASGKSTWVLEQAKPGDVVIAVIDEWYREQASTSVTQRASSPPVFAFPTAASREW
jgi:predicted kinase